MQIIRRTSPTKTRGITVTCAIPAVVEGFSTSFFLSRRRHFTNEPKPSFRHAPPSRITKRDSVVLESHHYGDCLSNIAHGGEVGGAFGSPRFGSAATSSSSSFEGNFPGCSSFSQEQEDQREQNTPQEKDATYPAIHDHHQQQKQQPNGRMDNDVTPIVKRKQDWMHSISNHGHDQLYQHVMTETTTTTSKFSDKNDKDAFVEGTTNEESPQVVDNTDKRIFVVPPSASSSCSSAASADVAPPEETSLEEKS